MFLNFQKITTATTSKRSSVLINADAIMLMEVDQLEDKDYGTTFDATRVEVVGFPNLGFHTVSTLDIISSSVKVIDARNGLGAGSTCGGDPGVVDFCYTITKLPMLKCSMIFNSSISSLQDYVFNPSFLIYAASIVFTDAVSRNQETGLLIVLRDAQPRRILTNLLYSDLCGLLGAIDIPT